MNEVIYHFNDKHYTLTDEELKLWQDAGFYVTVLPKPEKPKIIQDKDKEQEKDKLK